MKKIVLTAFAMLFAFSVLNAQQVQEQQVPYEKGTASGYAITTNYSAEIMNGAIQQKWVKDAGMKVAKYDGYQYFAAQQFPEISTQNLDVYVKAEESGKKKNKVTTVTMLVSTGNNNFISSGTDAQTAANIKKVLTDLVAYAATFAVEQNIAQNDAAIAKLQKEQQKLEKSKEKKQKELNDIEKKISDNKKEIDKLKQANNKLKQN